MRGLPVGKRNVRNRRQGVDTPPAWSALDWLTASSFPSSSLGTHFREAPASLDGHRTRCEQIISLGSVAEKQDLLGGAFPSRSLGTRNSPPRCLPPTPNSAFFDSGPSRMSMPGYNDSLLRTDCPVLEITTVNISTRGCHAVVLEDGLAGLVHHSRIDHMDHGRRTADGRQEDAHPRQGGPGQGGRVDRFHFWRRYHQGQE